MIKLKPQILQVKGSAIAQNIKLDPIQDQSWGKLVSAIAQIRSTKPKLICIALFTCPISPSEIMPSRLTKRFLSIERI
jgi:hypothetical protein